MTHLSLVQLWTTLMSLDTWEKRCTHLRKLWRERISLLSYLFCRLDNLKIPLCWTFSPVPSPALFITNKGTIKDNPSWIGRVLIHCLWWGCINNEYTVMITSPHTPFCRVALQPLLFPFILVSNFILSWVQNLAFILFKLLAIIAKSSY